MTKPILSTLHYPLRRRWVEHVEMLDPSLSPRARLTAVVRGARRHETVVLDGSSRVDPIAAAVLARRRRPPRIVIVDATWKLGPGTVDRAASRLGLRAIDGPHVVYCVFSTAERGYFPGTWGVDADRVRFVPWHYTLSEDELRLPVSDAGGVFAGGNSVRDYAPLVEAARGLDATVTIATSAYRPPSVPDNVRIGPVSEERFTSLTAEATVVVVALEHRRDRAAGQGTYLNAMVLGKTVIVPDVAGARDYIRHGETGMIFPPGDAAALRETLARVIGDVPLRRRLGEAARADVLARFGPERYVDEILAVAGT